MRPGDRAFSVGCDKGADPTVRQTHITAVNKYQGRPNVTAAGQPVDGRSGGGLHWVHMVATDSKGNVYTGKVDTGKRVQRFLVSR